MKIKDNRVEFDPENISDQIIQNALYLQHVVDRYNQALIDLNELVEKYTERKDERAFINTVVIYKELREFRDKFLGGPL